MKFFDKDPGGAFKTASSNHVTMPSRNWAMITENAAWDTSQSPCAGNGIDGQTMHNRGSLDSSTEGHNPVELLSKPKDGHSWLHKGEVHAGTKHKAANEEKHGQDADGSLDICIRVEMDQHNKEGKTQGYGMTIPPLVYADAKAEEMRKQDAFPDAISQRVR